MHSASELFGPSYWLNLSLRIQRDQEAEAQQQCLMVLFRFDFGGGKKGVAVDVHKRKTTTHVY